MRGLALSLCAVVLTAIGLGSIFLLILVPKHCRFPRPLHAHFWAAFIWTAITFFQTTSLLLYKTTPNLIGTVVAMLGGWTMISSWRQLIERQRGDTIRQSYRSLPHRLFVQTLWGPIIVWLVAITTPLLANRLVWRAIAHRDIVGSHLLKACGFSETNDYQSLETGLKIVVARQDTLGVLTYLEAGGEQNDECSYWRSHIYLLSAPLDLAESGNNTIITDLLLRYEGAFLKENRPLFLQIAIGSGNLREVRTMLHYTDSSTIKKHNAELFDIARTRHDPKLLALIRSAAAKP